ncbi:heavy-metal-associated domain-containing protein [Fusobacterium massiliense]|jgi:merTP family copper permease, binding protein copZ|uniref:heavy-metal-associated domain-containing protein n=1 Tax=Fusobacterium massiliense TaxID=1852365 RepID=UPI00093C9529|nr:cation transporter [Fusobacterium massiliense]
MKLNLKIEGMACEHCVKSVKKALEEIDEIKVLDVKVGSAEVEVKDESVLTKIREKLDDAGYDLI